MTRAGSTTQAAGQAEPGTQLGVLVPGGRLSFAPSVISANYS